MHVSPPTLQIRGARVSDAARVAHCYLASRKTLLSFAPLPHPDAEVVAWVSGRRGQPMALAKQCRPTADRIVFVGMTGGIEAAEVARGREA